MKASNFKRIAAAGAMSGALGLAALGLGSGVASADDDAGSTPTQPGEFSSDWQSYLPLLGNISAFVDLEKLGVPPEVANLGNGQWQNILGLVGG